MIRLNLNGKAASFDANPEMPLPWALREHLQLIGTEFGCSVALCGACTVHLAGRPVRSCTKPVSAAANAIPAIIGKRIRSLPIDPELLRRA